MNWPMILIGLGLVWFGVNGMIRSWRRIQVCNEIERGLLNGTITPDEAAVRLDKMRSGK